MPVVAWLPAGQLKDGENTLAIRVHQVSGRSSDTLFDWQLQAIDPTLDLESLDSVLTKHGRSMPALPFQRRSRDDASNTRSDDGTEPSDKQ